MKFGNRHKVILLCFAIVFMFYFLRSGSKSEGPFTPKPRKTEQVYYENPPEDTDEPGEPEHKKESQKVAFVISLTGLKYERWKKNYPNKPFPTGPPSMNYFDGAAVLAKSIELNFDFPYDLVAIIHESVKMDFTFLKKIGYRLLIVPTPVAVENITLPQGAFLRKEIVGSGCCGELELIKYEAYKLTEYSKIVLLDSDVILTKPHALSTYIKKLDEGTELIFNFDRSMASTTAKNDCVSAGFLVFRPSLEIYNFFIDTVKSGEWDGRGWKGTHMGFCYGGPTVQGLHAYYRFLNQNVSFESDSCRVNTIAFNFNYKGEDCKKTDPESIEMFHFSICDKPWACTQPNTDICKFVTGLWWKYRKMVEKDLGIPQKTYEQGCADGKYIDITRGIDVSTLKDRKH